MTDGIRGARVALQCPLCLDVAEIELVAGTTRSTCPSCQRPLLVDRPVPLGDEAFDRVLRGTELPVVVDFHAEWCAPCRMTAPLLDELALDMAGRAMVFKVDIDANPDAPLRLGVRSIPTLVAFRGGVEVTREVGMPTPARLRAMVEPELTPAA
ncbi:MAG: thioredoxin domain-containing protein [Gemmatimonadales bacterium]|nr:thioredoxin domain-containing protein [Gemmatimonadales bacterium]